MKEFIKKNLYDIYYLYARRKQNKLNNHYESISPQEIKDLTAEKYTEIFNKPLDWNNLNTYTEKMQYMKIFGVNDLMSKLTDKLAVRDWVSEKIGSEYLIPLLGQWSNFNEINFDELPDKFVLKTNNASGTNLIVKNKNSLDIKKINKQFKLWLNKKQSYSFGFQMQYKNIKPMILAEAYLEDESNELRDYKFLCFNGMVEYCWIDESRYSNHKRNTYDRDWNIQPWNQLDYGNTDYDIDKTINFEKMVEVAEILSKDFAHVRVDLYNVNGVIYFGEMTFTNGSGFEPIFPAQYDSELGKLWDLKIDSTKLIDGNLGDNSENR